MNLITISTVTPVYSGEAYLAELVARLAHLKEQWEKAGKPFCLLESIFVLDEAVDGSAKILADLARRHNWVHVVSLSKNFGQHPATMAGVLHTSGDWVVTLDEDLQHDPVHITELLKKAVLSEMDVMYACPQEHVHRGWRDLASRGYKGLMSKLLGIPHIRKFNSFRLIRGVIARGAASVFSHETYFDMGLCWFTYRIDSLELPLEDKRKSEGGKSGYTFRSLVQHARRLVISSRSKLLRVGVWVGGFAMLCSAVAGVLVVLLRLLAPGTIGVQGWASLVLLILFFGGLTSMLLSIILEFLTNLSLHSQGKPTYFIVNRSSDEIVKRSLVEN